jgi:hypothetical protein
MTIFSVNRQGWMQEQADLGAISHRAQAASAAGMALIAQFGGILDGQDVTPGYAVRNFLPAMLVKLFNRHGLVPQPTAKCDFLSNTARQFTQANAELLRHSLRKQRPFFAAVRRRSCQSPSRKIPLPTSRISRQTESHTSHDQHNVLPLAESVGRTRREVFIDQAFRPGWVTAGIRRQRCSMRRSMSATPALQTDSRR